MTKAERPGKVFVDWSQNNRHKTTIAVYSLRARPRPTVSTPVTWDEVEACADGREPLGSRPPTCWSGSTTSATCSRRCSRPCRSCRAMLGMAVAALGRASLLRIGAGASLGASLND